MRPEPPRFKRLVVVCSDCEDRSDGPRQLDSKVVAKELRRLSVDAPVRTRVTRTRCLGLCPRKALAVAALGEGLPAVSAELKDDADLRILARHAFGTAP